MTYFHMGNPHYHWRGVVSLSCSGWEGVGPTRYGRQTKLLPGIRNRDSGARNKVSHNDNYLSDT